MRFLAQHTRTGGLLVTTFGIQVTHRGDRLHLAVGDKVNKAPLGTASFLVLVFLARVEEEVELLLVHRTREMVEMAASLHKDRAP